MAGRDLLSRGILLLVGLLALAAGIGGLLAGIGSFGAGFEHRALFDNTVSRYVGHHGTWVWPVAAVVAVALAIACLRWLRHQLPPARMRSMRLASASGRGVTTLQTSAVTDAVARELEAVRGVSSARVRLDGTPLEPVLTIAVAVAVDGRWPQVRDHIEQEVVAHARAALERPHLPVRLDLDVTRRS